MNIKLKHETSPIFTGLKVGSVFQYNNNAWMKIEPCKNTGGGTVNAVLLQSGGLACFNDTYNIVPLGVLVVEK